VIDLDSSSVGGDTTDAFRRRLFPLCHMNLTALLRTVLTLLLTVSVMAQPMVACAMASSTEHVAVGETDVCAGCGCCELKPDESACCCCGDPSATTTDTVEEGNDSVASACHCCVTVPPLSRDLPRTELLSQLPQRIVTDRIQSDGFRRISLRAATDTWVDSTGARSDFSQRIFCVWRI